MAEEGQSASRASTQVSAARGYALVTGACSGIGLEIARELARRGHPLVLVSDRGTRLADAACQITADYQVDAQALQMDLSRPDAAGELYEQVVGRGLQVEILVSNAGMFFFGEVINVDPTRARKMMQLHVVTPSLLAHYFGRDMCSRGSGHILFTSSISAWGDFPGIAHYGSSKRYLRSFASSLREELSVYGVKVTCLAPGATATGLYAQTTVQVREAAKYGVMKDPSGVAQAAVKGMLRGKAVVIPGLSAKLMALAMTLTPRWVIGLVRSRSHFLSRPR